jgi:hypothetical protein
VDGMNLYEYVRSNPANLTDPQGLCGGTAPDANDIAWNEWNNLGEDADAYDANWEDWNNLGEDADLDAGLQGSGLQHDTVGQFVLTGPDGQTLVVQGNTLESGKIVIFGGSVQVGTGTLNVRGNPAVPTSPAQVVNAQSQTPSPGGNRPPAGTSRDSPSQRLVKAAADYAAASVVPGPPDPNVALTLTMAQLSPWVEATSG